MDKSKDLCGSCGMCCDGTLFPSFRIYAEEMDLFNTMSNTIPQSCEHFEGCNGCKIYNKREKNNQFEEAVSKFTFYSHRIFTISVSK